MHEEKCEWLKNTPDQTDARAEIAKQSTPHLQIHGYLFEIYKLEN